MKERNIVTLLVTFFVLVSLLLTYYLLYDVSSFSALINHESAEEISDQEILQKTAGQDYYQPTQLTFDDTLKIRGIFLNEGGQGFQAKGENFETAWAKFAQTAKLDVVSDSIVKGTDQYYSLFDGDYLEIDYGTPLPLETYDSLISDMHHYESFQFDQLLVPVNEGRDVYLANSQTHEYLEASFSRQAKKESCLALIEDHREDLLEVTRYLGGHGYNYLPIQSQQLATQYYVLESIPENIYVSQMFADGSDFSIPDSDGNTNVYKNFQYTLEVNRDQQRLDYMINRIAKGDQIPLAQQLKNSFKNFSQYEYWQGDLRLVNYQHGVLTYRRYLNDLPIYSPVGQVDYGASIVHLRNDGSGEMYRYQSPLLDFYAHIQDRSRMIDLESGQTIYDTLNQYGYQIEDFDHIQVAYEWQKDMDDFKRVELIPKWFFEFDGKMYSLDDIQSDSFDQIYQAKINDRVEEGQE